MPRNGAVHSDIHDKAAGIVPLQKCVKLKNVFYIFNSILPKTWDNLSKYVSDVWNVAVT
jgi:hypothetical protein